jgi:hypothetical protein
MLISITEHTLSKLLTLAKGAQGTSWLVDTPQTGQGEKAAQLLALC